MRIYIPSYHAQGGRYKLHKLAYIIKLASMTNKENQDQISNHKRSLRRTRHKIKIVSGLV